MAPSSPRRRARSTGLAALVAPVALAALVGAAGCPEATGPTAPAAPAGPARFEITSVDEGLRAVLPGDLLVHRHPDALQAATLDGAFRLHLERRPEAELLTLAGPGKDMLTALGWTVEGEQHYERAIHVRLRRGGTLSDPAERREVWWIARGAQVLVCDGIAARGAFDRLGERLRRLCQAVEVGGAAGDEGAPTPAGAAGPGPAAPGGAADAGPDGG